MASDSITSSARPIALFADATQCLLMAQSGHAGSSSAMSAFGGKADTAEIRFALWNSSSHDSSLRLPRESAAKPRTMEPKMLTSLHLDQKEMLHSIRTAVAGVGSLLIARFCRLPESYWAAITTIIITQSTLGADFGAVRLAVMAVSMYPA
jgi:hypothetical protein